MGARPAVLRYRQVVFVLALGYWIYQFHQMLDPTRGFGWQFRYLTIWALTASLLSAFAVLRLSMGWTDRRPDTLASVAAVMNALVVYLYWKLWFDDPSSVNGDGPIAWWQEYYLHALGPLLQWFDALFLLGSFRRVMPVLGVLACIVLAYVGWAELLVRPLNARPLGEVTSGLPYPFLNNMEFAARSVFYGGTAALSLIVVGAGWGLTRLIHRA